MKVAFADLPSTSIKETQAIQSPNLGILYLISYLREKITDLELYYIEPFLTARQHLEKLKEISPDVYGISFSSLVREKIYNFVKYVRKSFPNIPIIAGGAHPSADPEEVLQRSDIDICVIGEGEVTTYELIEHFKNNKSDISKIPGIAFKKNNQIIRTVPRPLIKDIDTIPMLAWDFINFNNYYGLTLNKKRPNTYIVASRGCPYHCTFCSDPVWKANKPWVRLRSPKNIAEEIKYLYNRGIREIYIRSSEFNVSVKWAVNICKEIQNLGLNDLFFQCNLRANNVTEELAREMHDANFWMVHIGIESGNDRALKGINKRINIRTILDTCKMLKKYKVKVYGFFQMFNIWEENNTLQFETPKEVERTLAFTRKLLMQGLISNISWVYSTPFPGSELYQIAKKYNILKTNLKDYDPYSISVILPGVSEKKMISVRRKGMILQGIYGLLSGKLNWRNWRHYLSKLKYILKSS
ncbi:MAG: B12-binding domain-containing radical SAM protein [Candidatus Helarchaeota archaeon]